MDLWTALFTVFRRWYVSLPIAVLGVVATIMIGGRIEQQYEAKASVVLVPAPNKLLNGIIQPAENIYDPRGAASAVFRRVSSPDLQREFEAEGLSKDFTVTLDQMTAIIDFAVTGNGADETLETAERLVSETRTNLARIQAAASVEPDATISLQVINISAEAEPVKGNKPRVMATIFVLGMVAAISAAFIVESFGNRRRQRAAGPAGIGMHPLQPMPGYAYQPMPGQVPGAAYMPVVQLPAVVAPGEVPAAAMSPVAAPASAVAPDDLYGSVDDLDDDLDDGLDAQHDVAGEASNGADTVATTDTRSEPRARGNGGITGRNGKGNGVAEPTERKPIDSGRRRGPRSSDRTTVPAIDTPTNGRPAGPGRDGGAKPSDIDASAGKDLIDLTATPVELDAEKQSSTPTAAVGRRQRTAAGGVDTLDSTVTTAPAIPTQRTPTAAATRAEVGPDVAVASPEVAPTAATEAEPADQAAAPVTIADGDAKRPTGNGSARTTAVAGRAGAKPGRRPAPDDVSDTTPPPAPTTVNAGTSSNARMRDSAKGRRASLFSASGDRKKGDTPPAE